MSTQTVNPRPERRVAINSSLLLLAYGFQALVSLVIVGIVARYLGQAGLGRYAFIISFIELFTVLVDMGMNRILVREIAKDTAQRDAPDQRHLDAAPAVFVGDLCGRGGAWRPATATATFGWPPWPSSWPR